MMTGRWIASLSVAVLVPLGAVKAADTTRAQAIAHLERLTAKAVLDESHLDLALAVGRVVDPELDTAAIKRQIAAMAKEARQATAGKSTPQEKVAALNKVIFQTHGFGVPTAAAPILSGDKVLDSYMLHRFVKTRLAHCEGLATLYMIISREASLPVEICNAPIHTYCRYEAGGSSVNIECTAQGTTRSDAAIHQLNGAKPAAVGSDIYFRPVTKKQFLGMQINALAYGLAKQEGGPAPLTRQQMVQLAELIEKLDPDRPESLDTAALIHSQAGNPRRATAIEAHVVEIARKYGTTAEIMVYFQETLNAYKQQKP
jgi:regulator of sirC expression with transglutaminase-like and TPR domain